MRAGDTPGSQIGSRETNHPGRLESRTTGFDRNPLLEDVQNRYVMAMSHRPVEDAAYREVRAGNRELLKIDDPSKRDGFLLQRKMLDAIGRPRERPFQSERARGIHMAKVSTVLDVVGLIGLAIGTIGGIDAGIASVSLAGVLLWTFPLLTTVVVIYALTGSEMKDRAGVLSRTTKLKKVTELAQSIVDLLQSNPKLAAAVEATQGVTGPALERARRKLADELIAHTIPYEASHRRHATDNTHVESRKLSADVAAARQVAVFPAMFITLFALSKNCKGGYGALGLVLGAVVAARFAQIGWSAPAGVESGVTHVLAGIGANTRVESKADIGSIVRDWMEQRMWLVGDKIGKRLNPLADEIGHALGISTADVWAFEEAGGFFLDPIAPAFGPEDQSALSAFHAHADGEPIDLADLPKSAPIDHDMLIDGQPLAAATGVNAELAVLTQLDKVERNHVKAVLLSRLRREAIEPSGDVGPVWKRLATFRQTEWTIDALRFDPKLRALIETVDPLIAHIVDHDLWSDVDRLRQRAAKESGLAQSFEVLEKASQAIVEDKALNRFVDQLLRVKGLQGQHANGRLSVIWNSPEIQEIRDNAEFMALVNDEAMDPSFDASTARTLENLRDKYVYRTTLRPGIEHDHFNEPDRRTTLVMSRLAGRKGLGKSLVEEDVQTWLEAKAKTSSLSYQGWKQPGCHDPEEDECRRQMSLTPLEHTALAMLRARPSISAAERLSGMNRSDLQLAREDASGPLRGAMTALAKLSSDPDGLVALRGKVDALRGCQLDESLRSWNMAELGRLAKEDVLKYMVEFDEALAETMPVADRPATNSEALHEATRVRFFDPGNLLPPLFSQVIRQFWMIGGGAGAALSTSVGLGFARRKRPDTMGHCVVGSGPDERELAVVKRVVIGTSIQLGFAVYNAYMAGGGAVERSRLQNHYYSFPVHNRPTAFSMARENLLAGLTVRPVLFNWRTSVLIPWVRTGFLARTGPRARREAARVRDLAFARLDELAGAHGSTGHAIDVDELLRVVASEPSASYPLPDLPRPTGVAGMWPPAKPALPELDASHFGIDLEAAMREEFWPEPAASSDSH